MFVKFNVHFSLFSGYIIAIVAISLIGAFAITLVGAVRCLRATRRASRALALPIPLLPEDRTPLNAEPEHSVPVSNAVLN